MVKVLAHTMKVEFETLFFPKEGDFFSQKEIYPGEKKQQ